MAHATAATSAEAMPRMLSDAAQFRTAVKEGSTENFLHRTHHDNLESVRSPKRRLLTIAP